MSAIVERAEKLRVLLVEDDQPLRRTLHRELEKRGFEVVSAYDASDALSTLSRRRADILVVDSGLPGISGSDLAALIVRADPKIKVLYISGKPLSEDMEVAAPSLSKPFTIQELIEAIHKALASTADR